MKEWPLVIMAAGIGSRYGGLKQVEAVGPRGEILLDYSIFDAIRAGFARFIFVTRREIESELKQRIESRWRGRIQAEYVYQELSDVPASDPASFPRGKPWGTGHAVYVCRSRIHSPFGVINADDFYGAESFALLAHYLQSVTQEGPNGVLVGFRLGNTLSEHGPVARGICEVSPDGYLRRIIEYTGIEKRIQGVIHKEPAEAPALTEKEVVSMNLWGFSPRLFEHLAADFKDFLITQGSDPKAEFMLPAVVDHVLRLGAGRIRVVVSSERWLGMTYPEDREKVRSGLRQLILRGVYPEML